MIHQCVAIAYVNPVVIDNHLAEGLRKTNRVDNFVESI
jgi:hypothetical protein